MSDPDPQTGVSSWSDHLAELGDRGLRRSLRQIDARHGAHVTLAGRQLCNFASNDYLGLATHPHIREAVIKAVERWGWGAGASRLVAGHMTPHAELEARLALFKDTEAALVCSTGYQANLAAIRALAGRGDVILLDKLDHASIIDAAFGTSVTPGDHPVVRVFPHRDYKKLQHLLKRYSSARRRIIVTDSVFSMDGDTADISLLIELKRRHAALLCIDEAHATGVFGPDGRGLAESAGVEEEIDVTVGTLSKALGGIGGFITGSRAFIDWVINTARSFVYTTALPPAACAAALAALDVVEHEPERRRRLLDLASHLREALRDRRGLDIAGSASQIVPVVVGENERVVEVSRQLEEAGFLVPAIRPPTVPCGKARLRISLSADHSDQDVHRLLAAIDRCNLPRIER